MAEAQAPAILFVEDDLLFQRTYRTHLEEAGYEVRLASDGENALRQIDASPPALVLLDLMLPRLSGYDVLARIRANPRSAQLPVIVLTNKGERDDIRRAMESGATDYFIKFAARPAEVLWKVRQVLAAAAGKPAAMRVAIREKELDAETFAEAAGKPRDLHCSECGSRLALELTPKADAGGVFDARLVCPKCGR